MTAFDYSEAHDDAVELITEFGQPSSFVIKGNGSGRAGDGSVIPATDDVNVLGIVSPLLTYKQSEVDGGSILSTDSYVFFDAYDGESIAIGMRITMNRDEYRAESINELISVDNIKVFSKIQLRR